MNAYFMEPGGIEAELHVNENDRSFARGRFGQMWKTWNKVHQTVAVKVSYLNGEYNTALSEFKSEIELLWRANICLFVISCIGWFVRDEFAGIVMEYAAGGSLYSLLHGNRHISIPNHLERRILHQICLGLNFLHGLSPNTVAIHGDLKSKNIVLTNELNVKICDLGGGKLQDRTEDWSTNELRPGERQVLTMLYAAPEVLHDRRKRRQRSSDIWSLGILASEIHFRQRPFHHIQSDGVYLAIINGDRPHDISSRGASASDVPILDFTNLCFSRPELRAKAEELVLLFNNNTLSYNLVAAIKQAATVRSQMEIPQETPLTNPISLLSALQRRGSRRSDEGNQPPHGPPSGPSHSSSSSYHPHDPDRGMHPRRAYANEHPHISDHRQNVGSYHNAQLETPRPLDVITTVPFAEKWRMVLKYYLPASKKKINKNSLKQQRAKAKSDKEKQPKASMFSFFKSSPKYVCLMVGEMGVGRVWAVNFFMHGSGESNTRDNRPQKVMQLGANDEIKLQFEFNLDKCKHADIVLYCFAIDRIDSFQSLCNIWIPEVSQKFGHSVPSVLVGMKADLRGQNFLNIAPTDIGTQLSKSECMLGYWECSARNGLNVHALFKYVSEIVHYGKSDSVFGAS